jgi:hypothetical protein
MGIRIENAERYRAEFPAGKREAAFRLALELRQFEIELYWKRATYFWTFMAATFGGDFAIAASDKSASQPGLFLASCIGLVLSTSWYLMNRGSKYWQENCERHCAGPLYKTTISNQQFRWFKLWDAGYDFVKLPGGRFVAAQDHRHVVPARRGDSQRQDRRFHRGHSNVVLRRRVCTNQIVVTF